MLELQCLPLPSSFDRSHLKLDIKYTYNSKEHVQHQWLVTYEECTSGHIPCPYQKIHGYMTPDEQYCVPECTGIYKPDPSGEQICVCSAFIALDGKNCLAECGPGYDAIQTSDPDVK